MNKMSKKSVAAHAKQAERDVAELLGGVRLHAGEWHGGGAVDVIADNCTWACQVKHRKDVAGYIQEGLQQLAEVRDKKPFQLMAIKTKPGSGGSSETYVLMRADEWNRMREVYDEAIDEAMRGRG